MSRGLKVEDKLLCIIDGGKSIRRALDAAFGDRAVIQRWRCWVQKQRDLRELLPKERHACVLARMREAYRAATARKLRALVSWLESNGREDAAASLREGP